MEKITEWDENIGITWSRESRIKLNKVIRKYNKWVGLHQHDKAKSIKLISKIERHLQMPYSNQDGGSNYRSELIKMKENVKIVLRNLPIDL